MSNTGTPSSCWWVWSPVGLQKGGGLGGLSKADSGRLALQSHSQLSTTLNEILTTSCCY